MKVRRFFFEFDDLVYVYIVGMDVFVRGLKVVYKLIEDCVFEDVI